MLVKKADCIRCENSSSCVVYEYPTEDKDINVAFAELNGRYPNEGYVSNTIVKEILYVLSGKGKIVIEEDENELAEGDMVTIPSNKKYFLEGNLKLIIPCTPAWSSEQHKKH